MTKKYKKKIKANNEKGKRIQKTTKNIRNIIWNQQKKNCYNCSMFDDRCALKSKEPETIPNLMLTLKWAYQKI